MKSFQDYLEVVNEAEKAEKAPSWERWKKQFNTDEAKGKKFLWINSGNPISYDGKKKDIRHLWNPQGLNAEKVYGSKWVWSAGASTNSDEKLGWNISPADFIAKAKNATVVNNKIATIKVPLINPDSNGKTKEEVKVFYGTVEDLISLLEN